MSAAPDNLSAVTHKFVEDSFPQLVAFVQRAVSFNGVPRDQTPEHPFGQTLTDSLNDFLNIARSMEFRTKNINNSVGYVEMGGGEALYGIMCHLDVVPEGEHALWKYPPFKGVVDGGRLYGRGSIDDKGPAAAALFAMKALLDSGCKLNCRIRLIVGLDEETGLSRCMEEYKKYEEIPRYSFSPDANFPLINAEKGILRCHICRKFIQNPADSFLPRLLTVNGGTRINVVPDTVTAVFQGDSPELLKMLKSAEQFFTWERDGENLVITGKGVSAHAMQPQKGKNAVVMLLFLLSSIRYAPDEVSVYLEKIAENFNNDLQGKALGIACRDDISGELTCNMAILKLDGQGCTISLDIRYPVTADGSDIIAKLEKAVPANLGAELMIEQHTPPLHIPAESPFIQVLLEAYENVTGEKGYTASTGGGTYCRNMPNSVSFGAVFPNEEEQAHRTDEYVELDSLKKAAHIYAEALYLINKSTEKL